METVLLEFVCCLADGCAPQAKGHFFGSGNLGAGADVLRGTVRLVEGVGRGVGRGCVWTEGEAGRDRDRDRLGEWGFLGRVGL